MMDGWITWAFTMAARVFVMILVAGFLLEMAGRTARKIWKAWTTDGDDWKPATLTVNTVHGPGNEWTGPTNAGPWNRDTVQSTAGLPVSGNLASNVGRPWGGGADSEKNP